ncbi:MAG: restriction endonuclease subunit S [Candidatus Nanopelagicales bacterium]|nr:restriction endonuclease subunit S [Candidatus Nanopelagicales bacterium]
MKFEDMVSNVSNRVDDPSSAGVDRYVGLEHLDPGSMVISRWGSPSDVQAQKLLFQPEDVIFGRRRAYQKKVAQADFKGICSAHALVLRATPGAVDPRFLPVFLSSEVFLTRAVKISVGSLSPTVNWKTLKDQEFDLPPLDEQRRIADLLWAVEEDRESSKALMRACQVTFRSLLLLHTQPREGETVTVEEVVDVLDSKRVPLSASVRANRQGSIPYYGAAGQIDSVDKHLFDEDLVLLCEDGFGLAAWNERPIAYQISGPAWVNNHAHVLRARAVSTDWLRFSLMHYDLRPFISTTVKPKLNLSTVRALRMRKTEDEASLVEELRQAENAVAAAQAIAEADFALGRWLRDQILRDGAA